MPARLKVILAVGFLVIGLGIGAIIALTILRGEGVSLLAEDRGGFGTPLIGGAFALIDQTGTPRTDADYRGRFMLIYFGYTFCPDVCPTSLQVMGQALDQLSAEEQAAIQPILITVDPARDTVAVLKDYVPHFHERLVGLTGSEAQVAAAAKAYRVFYRKSSLTQGQADYLVDHSSIVYLMDRNGAYRTHFTHEATPEAMAAALRKAIAEAKP